MSVRTLGDLVEREAPICYGILKPGMSVQGGVPVIKVRDYNGGRVSSDDLLLTSEVIDNQYARSRLLAGDILLSIRGTTGRVAIVPQHLEGANITQDSARIRVPAAERQFVYHALRSASLQRQIRLHTVGQAVQGINIASVRRLELPWPDSRTRNAIAQIGDVCDRQWHALTELISAKRRLRSELMRELVTGKRRFQEFADCDYTEVKLADVCQIEIGGTPRRDTPEYWATSTGSGFPWVSIGDLSGRWIHDPSEHITALGVANSSTKLVPKGTTMMSFKLTIGRVGRAARDVYTNEAIAAFYPRDMRVSDAYLYEALPLAVRHANPDVAVKGATLNKAKLAEIPLRLPSLEEQGRIAAVGEALDSDIQLSEELRNRIRAHAWGLMQELLSGPSQVLARQASAEFSHG